MKSTTTTVMAGVALALFACSSSDFNTPTLLNKPRILAIQAEPPQPALGASTTLRPLVYLPPPSADGGAAVVVTGYRWSWCPLATSSSNGYACPIGPDAGDSSLPGLPPLDLGTGETATFTNPFPAAVLGSLCNGNLDAVPGLAALAASMGSVAASGGLTFHCTIAGFPITVYVAVQTSDGKEMPAVFTVYLPINDAIPANLNPVVGDIYVTADNSDTPDPSLRLDQAGTQKLVRNSRVPLVLDMPLSDSEILPDPNQVLPNPNPKDPNSVLGPNNTPRERLYVNWYAECGDFGGSMGEGGDTTGYLGGDPNDPVSPFIAARLNYWNIPTLGKYEAKSARVILVVRDSRGGVTWTSGLATLMDQPPDAGASDAPEADSGEATSAPDAEASDAPEADAGELAPDAGAPDAEQGNSVDALLGTTP